MSEADPRDADGDIETGGYDAPYDDVIAEGLGAPNDPLEIYLEEASWYRPISTGDIFRDVAVPGNAPHAEAPIVLSMVVAHPSAMRKGAVIEDWVRAAPVAPIKGLRKTTWSAGFYDVFPLPLLSAVAGDNGFQIPNRAWGTMLELTAPTESNELDVRQRVACLSPDGVHLLLQRVVHSHTRVAIHLPLLEKTFAAKLDELDLQEEWNEKLVEPHVADDGADLRERLLDGAHEFDDALAVTPADAAQSIGAMLTDASQAASARRHVRAEIRRRLAEQT